jgi:muramoyltetrapeptide carboxypeptidase
MAAPENRAGLDRTPQTPPVESARVPATDERPIRLPGPIIRRPPRLRAGDRVALVAPASPPGDDGITRALDNVRALGFEPVLGAYARASNEYLAGSDGERAADLNDALNDPSIRAIVALRGGYGVMRILDRVDFDALARDPKIVMGYSDLTALLNAFAQRSGVATLHGPVAYSVMSETTFARTRFALTTAQPLDPLRAARTTGKGRVRARVCGGNLALVTHLCGTPYAVDMNGALVALEDVNEAPYRVDRMLTQLRLAGTLAQAAAFALGDMPASDLAAREVADLGRPVLAGLPFGHIEDAQPFAIGLEAELDAEVGLLTPLEPLVD